VAGATPTTGQLYASVSYTLGWGRPRGCSPGSCSAGAQRCCSRHGASRSRAGGSRRWSRSPPRGGGRSRGPAAAGRPRAGLRLAPDDPSPARRPARGRRARDRRADVRAGRGAAVRRLLGARLHAPQRGARGPLARSVGEADARGLGPPPPNPFTGEPAEAERTFTVAVARP